MKDILFFLSQDRENAKQKIDKVNHFKFEILCS